MVFGGDQRKESITAVNVIYISENLLVNKDSGRSLEEILDEFLPPVYRRRDNTVLMSLPLLKILNLTSNMLLLSNYCLGDMLE